MKTYKLTIEFVEEGDSKEDVAQSIYDQLTYLKQGQIAAQLEEIPNACVYCTKPSTRTEVMTQTWHHADNHTEDEDLELSFCDSEVCQEAYVTKHNSQCPTNN